MPDNTAKLQRAIFAGENKVRSLDVEHGEGPPYSLRHGDVEQCYFYQLPRELRDVISHHLWELTPYIRGPCGCPYDQCHQTQPVSLSFSVVHGRAKELGHSHPPRTLPRWLLTDKRFLEEGLGQLRRNGRWELAYFGTHPLHTPKLDIFLRLALAQYVNMGSRILYPSSSPRGKEHARLRREVVEEYGKDNKWETVERSIFYETDNNGQSAHDEFESLAVEACTREISVLAALQSGFDCLR
ncbi:hypothetical protein EK21DRAFT_107881 [Setomelanomma holmii]|uniref:Uncharacterized protein n=1 Tax=Setomelanomma holmii TaxID=210430 RepID=A0A9P4HHW9_9PLEO|nr:hypothetical protein EK21DRAFT_107881 [Setomelanomma holmii]